MVSGYLISTNLLRVEGLSTDPWDLGCHIGKKKVKRLKKARHREKAVLGLSPNENNLLYYNSKVISYKKKCNFGHF